MPNAPIETVLTDSPLTGRFISRPRIDAIFDRATRCKLVYVIAGAGYGKTRAVHHYIKNQPDAVVRWLQLNEGDNVGSGYWEHLAHNIAFDNPDLAARLREFGFPDTLARFKQFAEILKSTEHRSRKTFLVLDDFHLVQSKQALTFAERCAYLKIPGACVIIISRNEPGINAVSLLARGNLGIITEDELRYTGEELSDFFRQSGIPFSGNDIPRFLGATNGWAFAVKLLSLVLARMPQDTGRALEVMKQNIFKLLEIEAFSDFPESAQKTLVRLSLTPGLLPTSLQGTAGGGFFTENAPQLASFMWYDSLTGDYKVHPLYMEFLQSKQHMLSEDEKLDAYRRAAQWCCENSFTMDAMTYFAKSRQFDRILDIMLSYPFKLPYDACKHMLGILEAIEPCGGEPEDRSVLILRSLIRPLLYAGMGDFDKARELSLEAIKKWERSDAPLSSYLLYIAYMILAYIGLYTCTVTHSYDFAGHLKKAFEYLKTSSVPPVETQGPFSVVDVRAFACLVGDGADLREFDRFVETAREAALYIDQSDHNIYSGYSDLAACELAFFRNQLSLARNFANNSVLEARRKKQYSIEAMAQYYLLRMAIHEGDGPLTSEMLKQLRDHLDNADFWNRQLMYDLFAGSFYAHVGLVGMAPSWLALDEKDTVSDVHIPARELIVGVRYHFARGKFQQALAILCNSYPREPQERFHFGELIFSLLFAVARLRTGDAPGAADDFIRAYEMSFGGEFEMPFIELGKAFKPLAAAVTAREDNPVPDQWLKTTGRKASIYAKKTAVIMNMVKREYKAADTVHLSGRELEVLKDLYHGLSRDEIAANQFLSRNTVDKVLQSIFIKLEANNSSDALRIAIEKKLID